MSFIIELGVEGLSEAQGRAIEAACAEPGAWPLRYAPLRRRRLALFGPRQTVPGLWVPDEQDLLADDADTDMPSWAMEPAARRRFAETIEVLGQELPQGFSLRATWVGSEVRHERQLSAEELAALARASQLNEFTRYLVPGRR